MFDQDAEESLHRSKQRPVNHDRPVRFVVFADVFELKTLWQIEVELDRRQLPGAANRVLDTNINLRPVERRFAFDTLVRNPAAVQSINQSRFTTFPIGIRTEVSTLVLAPDGKLDFVILKAKRLVDIEGKLDATDDLAAHRFRSAEDVCVVLRKPTRTNQPVQRARKLSSVARSQLSVTQRQIPVRMLRRLIDTDVKRAVHRLDAKLLALEFHRREHGVDIVDFMPAREPQLAFGNMRREDEPVASKQQLPAQVVFHLLADRAAFRMPEDQPLPVLFLNRKQIQFAAQATMIALLCLFTLFQPGIELFLREKGRAVDALHLLLRRVAFPVSAGQRKQFESTQL